MSKVFVLNEIATNTFHLIFNKVLLSIIHSNPHISRISNNLCQGIPRIWYTFQQTKKEKIQQQSQIHD